MKYFKIVFLFICIALFSTLTVVSREYHVSVKGSDDGDGTLLHPFKTIMEASRVARAGDTITVHEGTYREWVDPQYGGASELTRILYRAADGEKVIITGSEIIKGWEKAGKGV